MSEDLTVLIIGGGGREHVISCAYEQSPRVKKIIVAPGNDFIGFRRGKEVVIDKDCDLKDAASICAIAEKYRPDLIDVAQDDALATHAADNLRPHFRVFAPQQARLTSFLYWRRPYFAPRSFSPASELLLFFCGCR